jgi:Zn finger protein HypA/HybF involved in hydrogenase expression
MKTTIDTRLCTSCNGTYRAQGLRPQCPRCKSDLSIVLDSRTTNDPSHVLKDRRDIA